MRYELFHSAFETEPVCAATMESDLPVEESIEQLYKATQNVESSWVKTKGQFGIQVTPSDAVIAAGGARSTSVGDYIAVHRDEGLTVYRCMPFGWQIDPNLGNVYRDDPSP